MPELVGLRLDRFMELPYQTKKNLLCHPHGRTVDSLLIADLSPGDLVRVIDWKGDAFLLEVIDPKKRTVWLIHFPPPLEMWGCLAGINWGVCEISNLVSLGDDCFFFYFDAESVKYLARISDPRIIRILEERGRSLPDY